MDATAFASSAEAETALPLWPGNSAAANEPGTFNPTERQPLAKPAGRHRQEPRSQDLRSQDNRQDPRSQDPHSQDQRPAEMPSGLGRTSTAASASSFGAIGSQLEQRRRESAILARRLEQHRSRLHAVTKERNDCYEKFGRIAQLVDNAARSLADGMAAREAGEHEADADELFELNARALDELESVATSLSVHLSTCRSAWNDYVGSVEAARKLAVARD